LYILQRTLFSFEELQTIESKSRLPILFSSLDLRPYAKELVSSSPQGAPPHSREAIIRALLAAPLVGISAFTALHYRFDTDESTAIHAYERKKPNLKKTVLMPPEELNLWLKKQANLVRLQDTFGCGY